VAWDVAKLRKSKPEIFEKLRFVCFVCRPKSHLANTLVTKKFRIYCPPAKHIQRLNRSLNAPKALISFIKIHYACSDGAAEALR
jgi:hypothetical protein